MILQMLKKESFGTVFGLVAADQTGQPVQGIPVTLFFPDANVTPTPDSGIIVPTQTPTDANGTYQFSNIPFGNIPFGERSLGIAPKLVLAPNSAKTVNGGEDVRLTVTNFSSSTVDIVSVKVSFKINTGFQQLTMSQAWPSRSSSTTAIPPNPS